MSLILDLKNKIISSTSILSGSNVNSSVDAESKSTIKSSNTSSTSSSLPMLLKAPQPSEIKFFNESGPNGNSSIIFFQKDAQITNITTPGIFIQQQQQVVNKSTPQQNSPVVATPILTSRFATKEKLKSKKKVTFPDDEKIIKDYSLPPKRGWIPGSYSTSDLLDSYLKSCDRHKCKPLNKLMPQLKALQDLDCINGEKVNVLNLKAEKLDSKQMEAIEEIFKRLSFKTIDLESSVFDDDSAAATLFEILEYYDTCERLILANNRSMISLFGWQSLSKFIRKSLSLEYLDLRGHTFPELIYFTYLARSIKLTLTLRVIHFEFSNIQGRLLLMLAAALKDNEQIKEIYLGDNKLQPSDGNSIASLIKENKCLELLDLRNNNLQDIGLSHVCSGLSELVNLNHGLSALVISNNNITANGISYLSKALIHNRSLITLNIGQNTLTNEAVYELKEALIVNKQISSLFLNKIKLSDEGVIALAEYIAETSSLTRLDLRDNDIRLGGLMALVSSLKFNKTLNRLDLDREPKRESSIKDSVETSKRLLQDINEYCSRNKRAQLERELEQKEQAKKLEDERRKQQIENEKQLIELVKELNDQMSYDECKSVKTGTEEFSNLEDLEVKKNNDETKIKKTEEDDEEEDQNPDNDVLLKKILSRNLSANLLSPINLAIGDDLINYFNVVDSETLDDQIRKEKPNPQSDLFQLVEKDLTVIEDSVDLDLALFRADELADINAEKKLMNGLINKSVKIELDAQAEECVHETAKKLVKEVIEKAYAFYLSNNESNEFVSSTPSKPIVTQASCEIKNDFQSPLFVLTNDSIETNVSKEDGSSIIVLNESCLLSESKLTSFNDSNDLSCSIEKVNQLNEDLNEKKVMIKETSNSYQPSLMNNSIGEEEDSDIEVLKENSPPNRTVEVAKEEKVDESSKQANIELLDNLIFSSSPLQGQTTACLGDFNSITLSPPDSVNKESFEESTNEQTSSSSTSSLSTSFLNQEESLTNKSNHAKDENKPFFTSKLTTSQLSQELNEIGLSCE